MIKWETEFTHLLLPIIARSSESHKIVMTQTKRMHKLIRSKEIYLGGQVVIFSGKREFIIQNQKIQSGYSFFWEIIQLKFQSLVDYGTTGHSDLWEQLLKPKWFQVGDKHRKKRWRPWRRLDFRRIRGKVMLVLVAREMTFSVAKWTIAVASTTATAISGTIVTVQSSGALGSTASCSQGHTHRCHWVHSHSLRRSFHSSSPWFQEYWEVSKVWMSPTQLRLSRLWGMHGAYSNRTLILVITVICIKWTPYFGGSKFLIKLLCNLLTVITESSQSSNLEEIVIKKCSVALVLNDNTPSLLTSFHNIFSNNVSYMPQMPRIYSH